MAPISIYISSIALTSCTDACVRWMKTGRLPLKSICVCIFMPPLFLRNLADGQRIQACFDITQAVLVGILSHAHYKKLIMTGKIPDSVITLVPGNYFVEFSTRNKLHNLSENCFAGIHFVRYLKGNVKVTNSNRVQEIQSIYC